MAGSRTWRHSKDWFDLRLKCLAFLLSIAVSGNATPDPVSSSLPAGTGLRLNLAGGLELAAPANGEIVIGTGEPIESIALELPIGYYFQMDSARIRAANSTGAAGAKCEDEALLGPEVADAPLGEAPGAILEVISGSRVVRTLPFVNVKSSVAFKNAGRYRICYAVYTDGKYALGHVVPIAVDIVVEGVTAQCTSSGCLPDRVFKCYRLPDKDGPPGACGVGLPKRVGSTPTDSRLTWSGLFQGHYGANGKDLPTDEAMCASNPEPNIFAATGLEAFVPANSVEISLPSAMPGQKAITVAACYCSGVRQCLSHSSFNLKVGIIQFFVATAAPPSDVLCETVYPGLLAPLPFAVCIHCPPEGCNFGLPGGRLKLVKKPSGINEVPAWLPGHSCFDEHPTPHLRPSGKASTDSDGGERADFKRFVPLGSHGFRLNGWPNSEPLGSAVDVCLCLEGGCKLTAGEWFKTGELAVVPPQLRVSASMPGSIDGSMGAPPMEVGEPGQIAMNLALQAYGNPYPVLGLQEKGGIRFVVIDRLVDKNAAGACLREDTTEPVGYSSSDIPSYSPTRRGDRLVFDGGTVGRGITIETAGNMAVCYCGVMGPDGITCEDHVWAPVGIVNVEGPRTNHYWIMPTNRVTRLEFHGSGLLSSDTLKFIRDDQNCEDDPAPMELCPLIDTDKNGNTHEYPMCKHVDGQVDALYEVQTLTHTSVRCDEKHVSCLPTALVKHVEARNTSDDTGGSGVRLRFATVPNSPGGLGDLGLKDGDVIVLEKGIRCHRSEPGGCNRRVLQEVRGYQPLIGLETYVNFDGRAPLKDKVGQGSGFLLKGAQLVNGSGQGGIQTSTGYLRLSSWIDALVVDTSDGFDASGSWSLVFWMRFFQSGARPICGLGQSGYEGTTGVVEVGVDSQSHLYLVQNGTVSVSAPVGTSSVSMQAQWVHVGVVYSGWISGGLEFYLNGQMSYAEKGVVLSQTDLHLVCGGVLGQPTTDGVVDIDELRWYNLPISADDVLAASKNEDTDKVDLTADADLRSFSPLGNVVVKPNTEDPRLFDLPSLEWPENPRFEMVENDVGLNAVGTGWRVTNRANTKAEIVTPIQQYVKVCWQRIDEKGNRSAPVGSIAFRHATKFSDVAVFTTADEWRKTSPFILTFKTAGPMTSTGKRYSEAIGTMTLEVSFMNTQMFDLMHSALDTTFGMEIVSNVLPSNQIDPPNQKLCGSIFKELWSDDPEGGFPMPKGCTMRLTSATVREIVIHFEPRNGLRAGYNYHLVMNAWPTNQFDRNEEVILVQSGDDIDSRRHEPHEVGHAYANKGFMIGGSPNDPNFADDNGVEILGGDDGNPWLAVDHFKPSLTFLFRGGTWSTSKIKKNCLLNLWLWPLTQWRMPERCADDKANPDIPGLRILCDVHTGNFRRCGEVTECSAKQLVPYMPHVSEVRVRLPTKMNDLYGTNVYRMRIRNFLVPDQGFFPRRMMVQLRTPDGDKPDYILSSGKYISILPKDTAMTARLLYRGEESLPFEGDPVFLVYLKLLIPTSIRGSIPKPPVDVPRPASTLNVLAPNGFAVLGVAQAPADLGQSMITPDGDGAAKLSISFPETSPTGFGFPKPSGWVFDGAQGTYTLPEEICIFAGSSLVLGLRVRPKNKSLAINDLENEWRVTVQSSGDLTMPSWNYSKILYRTGLGGVPVLGELGYVFVQASDPRPSLPGQGPVKNELSVFFKSPQQVPGNGFVDVEAPFGFDFGKTCVIRDLSEEHYAFGHARSQSKLPSVVECRGYLLNGESVVPPLNLARIQLEGLLLAGVTYGFRITITNPKLEDYSGAVGWNVRTRGPMLAEVSTTKEGASGAIGSGEPFVLREAILPVFPSLDGALQEPVPGIAVAISSMVPSLFTDIVMILQLPFDITGEMRVIGPEGFEWLGGSVTRTPGDPWESQISFIPIPGFVTTRNEALKFNGADFQGGVRYGFQASIYVPAFTPVASVPAFFIDVAPSGTEQGRGKGVGAIVPAPRVKALSGATVRASNRLPGARTELLFEVWTATDIAEPGALYIQAPPGYGTTPPGVVCKLFPWPGRSSWDSQEDLRAGTCEWIGDLLAVRPPPDASIRAGRVQFRIEAQNPSEPDHGPQSYCRTCWIFGSFNFSNLNPPLHEVSEAVPVLDRAQTFIGLPVAQEAAQMFGFFEFSPPGRDDRPLRKNRVAFIFRLSEEEAVNGTTIESGLLEVAAPTGFRFSQRCLDEVDTRKSSILGDKEYTVTKELDLSPWESEAKITSCEGNGRYALLSVDSGLFVHRRYMFTLMVQNAEVAAEDMTWTLSFNQYFSKPFASFALWTFTDVTLTPLTFNAAPSCVYGQCIGAGLGVGIPLTLTFRNFREILSDGVLQVTAPPKYGFQPDPDSEVIDGEKVTPCILREYSNVDFSGLPVAFTSKDVDCLIANRGNTLDGSGTGDTRTIRVIPRWVFNEVDPAPPRTIRRQSSFVLIVFIIHPPLPSKASHWVLESFSPEGKQLDIGRVEGYDVTAVMWEFKHNNKDGYNEYSGKMAEQVVQGRSLVPFLVFEFVLPENAWTSDNFLLRAPPTFNLQRPVSAPWSPASCINLTVLAPETAATSRYGAGTPAICKNNLMRLPLSNFGASVQSGDPVKLQAEVVNPEIVSPDEEMYWIIEHFRSDGVRLASSAIMHSWPVIPKLWNATVALSGRRKTQGSFTNITFEFRTVSKASEILIEGLQPISFDFGNAYSLAVIEGRNSVPSVMAVKGSSIRLLANLEINDTVVLDVNNVRLPSIPGRSQWRVSTFSFVEVGTPVALMDMDIFNGFMVPGKITVHSMNGRSGDVPSAILGRKPTAFTLRVQSTVDFFVGDIFQIAVLEKDQPVGFAIFPEGAVIFDANGSLTASWICADEVATSPQGPSGITSDANNVEVESSLDAHTAAGRSHDCCSGFPVLTSSATETCTSNLQQSRQIAFRVNSRIVANTTFTLQLNGLTPLNRTVFLREVWRFNVYSSSQAATSGELELKTSNDEQPVPLSVVTMLPEVILVAEYVPPLVRTQVTMMLDPVDTQATFFVITAPVGFSFPGDCNYQAVNGTDDAKARCTAFAAATAPVPRALVTCAPANGTSCFVGKNTTILIDIPAELPPGDIGWTVEATDEPFLPYNSPESMKAILGRTRPEGFEIDPMEARVTYASAAGVSVDVGVVFESRVALPAGGAIFIKVPPMLRELRCGNRERGDLKILSVKGHVDCDYIEDEPGLVLRPNASVHAGLHVLTIPAETPLVDPEKAQNQFEIYLRDEHGLNLDVALNVPGETVEQGFRLSLWHLRWVQAMHFATTVEVTLPLEVLNDVDRTMGAIAIVPPSGPLVEFAPVTVQVDTIYGKTLPVTNVRVEKDKITVALSTHVKLTRALHMIRFTIKVPRKQALFNLWQILICAESVEDFDFTSCSVDTAPLPATAPADSVISVFSLPGFDPYKKFPGTVPVRKTNSASPHRSSMFATLASFVVTGVACRLNRKT